jgi:hypothetical protein
MLNIAKGWNLDPSALYQPLETQMTRQEIFDTVAAAILKQGKPSMRFDNGSAYCVYLADDGSRCAVGHLFNDKELMEYGRSIMGISSIVKDTNGLRSSLGQEVDLLSQLQSAHDIPAIVSAGDHFVPAPIEVWRNGFIERMKTIARDFNLSTEALNAHV